MLGLRSSFGAAMAGWLAADSCQCAPADVLLVTGEEGEAELPNFINTRSALRTRGRDPWRLAKMIVLLPSVHV
jgi:hypothetical protein